MGTRSIPISDQLLAVNELLTRKAYRRHEITGSRAAPLLGRSLEQFMAYASEQGVPIISVSEAELVEDVRTFGAFLDGVGRR